MSDEEKPSPNEENSKALVPFTDEKAAWNVLPKPLRDILHDTPIYQHVWKRGHVQGWAEGYAQGRAEGMAQGWAEGHTQAQVEEHELYLQQLRELLMRLVQARFAKLRTLTRGQVTQIEDAEILEDLLIKLAMAATIREAQEHLINWEQDEE